MNCTAVEDAVAPPGYFPPQPQLLPNKQPSLISANHSGPDAVSQVSQSYAATLPTAHNSSPKHTYRDGGLLGRRLKNPDTEEASREPRGNKPLTETRRGTVNKERV